MRRSGLAPRDRFRWAVAGLAVVLAAVLTTPGGVAASPPLPVGDGSAVLSGVTAPVLTPGAGGAIDFTVANPLASTATGVDVSLSVYAFNAYPGNATGAVPSDAPLLSAAGARATSVQLALGDLSAGQMLATSVPVSTDGGVPSGDFAVRFSVSFSSNGTAYTFESRGYFTAAQWANATTLPGGGPTLNLSRLGVSGVVPETAVLVRENPFPTYLWALLAVAVALAVAGGYFAWRPGPGSSSGATSAGRPSHAPRAFGKRRTKDGD